jgi:hypothetical protein
MTISGQVLQAYEFGRDSHLLGCFFPSLLGIVGRGRADM